MKFRLIRYWSGELVMEVSGTHWKDCIDITDDPEFTSKGRVKSLRRLRVYLKKRYRNELNSK